MIEEWKYIEETDNNYLISNLGRVKSLINNRVNGEYIIKQRDFNHGYEVVKLRANKKTKKFLVHRLVAKYFVPNIDNLPQVNHKDENKLNNVYTNLEWCTSKYNQNYGNCIRKRVEHTDWSKLHTKEAEAKRKVSGCYVKSGLSKRKPVLVTNLLTGETSIYDKTSDVWNNYKDVLPYYRMQQCLRGELSSFNNYSFKYIIKRG